jgi:hypothetical protein
MAFTVGIGALMPKIGMAQIALAPTNVAIVFAPGEAVTATNSNVRGYFIPILSLLDTTIVNMETNLGLVSFSQPSAYTIGSIATTGRITGAGRIDNNGKVAELYVDGLYVVAQMAPESDSIVAQFQLGTTQYGAVSSVVYGTTQFLLNETNGDIVPIDYTTAIIGAPVMNIGNLGLNNLRGIEAIEKHPNPTSKSDLIFLIGHDNNWISAIDGANTSILEQYTVGSSNNKLTGFSYNRSLAKLYTSLDNSQGAGAIGAFDFSINNLLASPLTFPAWQAANFTAGELAQSTISGANATPMNDGVPNLLKYALGYGARTTVPANACQVALDLTQLSLTYTRPGAISDVTYIVEGSTNLSTWTPVTQQRQSLDAATGTETWRASVSPIGPRQFLRLRITLAP